MLCRFRSFIRCFRLRSFLSFCLLCLSALCLLSSAQAQGNWKITVSYSGSCTTTSNGAVPPFDIATYTLQHTALPANGSFDLSTLATSSTTTGGATVSL